jgi:ERCC4-type nuclease
MIIKIDSRESDLYSLCKQKMIANENITVIQEILPLGDIVICNNEDKELIVIERKTLRDLAASIVDGRYNEQSFRLNQLNLENHNIIYLIEGNLNNFKPISRIDKNALLSSMVTLHYFKGFSVFRTLSIQETSDFIIKNAVKIFKEQKPGYYNKTLDNIEPEKQVYSSVLKCAKKNQITKDNIGEIMLAQIPGISHQSSKAIMSQFKNIDNLILSVKQEPNCLDDIKVNNRKISKTCIKNIKIFLLNENE